MNILFSFYYIFISKTLHSFVGQGFMDLAIEILNSFSVVFMLFISISELRIIY